MNQNIDASDFYVAGGTLRPNTPSYAERPADTELLNLALKGEFCYILTSRQLGKSSLMTRTARRLKTEGVQSVIVDLTSLGTANISVEQWYLGLLNQIKRKLRLSVDLEGWWQAHANLGYVQRFTSFLHDVVLEEVKEQVVIFVDEIDSTLNLDFSDDFFAAIRFIYNARATDAIYERITFVLLGVAIPADLIKDRKRTPFNIGQPIDLGDFTHEDTQPLQRGLYVAYPEQAKEIFARIYHWTNGHPYLTQKLCLSLLETDLNKSDNGNETTWDDEKVDALVERLFLSKEASKETNLQFVRDYVTNSPHKRELLTLYRQIYSGKSVSEEKGSMAQNQLKLFGLVRVEDNLLKVRNEIYRRVFNQEWIKTNMPIDWNRRILIGFGLVILLLIAIIGFNSFQQQEIAEQARLYTAEFRNSTDPNVRLTNLAGLFDLPGFEEQAKKLFFSELSPAQQIDLFESATPQIVGSELTTAVQGLYTDLNNNDNDNALLDTMVQPLELTTDSRARSLVIEIKQWLLGREQFNNGNYSDAAKTYTSIINTINNRNPGVFLDRGLAYAELGEAEKALNDFELVINEDPNRTTRIALIGQVASNTSPLYEAIIAGGGGGTYQKVADLVPSPTSTSTPTPTNTSTPTPTPTSTYTPTPTVTPIPTDEPTVVVPTEAPTVAPVEVATEAPPTPIPTDTPTPLPTPTPTPRPATVVFVQSNFNTHELGLITSSGESLADLLHPRAAAPAWSPNGQRIAFFGEEGISQLGGVYAQGTGIWILNPQTGEAQLLFQFDHVRNLVWSPDGSKLAFEYGPPDVTHEIYIIDAIEGREIIRFPGEQPAWSPDGQELVIKTCSPECGLWKVGFDGKGGSLLTKDSTDSYPAWSPNGEHLVFSSRFRQGDWEIYRLDFETDVITQLVTRPGTDTTPTFSSDGLEVYYRSDTTGQWQIRVMAIDGTNDRAIRDNVGTSDDWGLARPAVR